MIERDDYGLTKEQEDCLYNFKIGCEGWIYFEALVNNYACEPKKACNWMVNYLFPILKRQLKDEYGWDLTLIQPDVLAGFIQSNDRTGLKNYFN